MKTRLFPFLLLLSLAPACAGEDEAAPPAPAAFPLAADALGAQLPAELRAATELAAPPWHATRTTADDAAGVTYDALTGAVRRDRVAPGGTTQAFAAPSLGAL